ncbi:MAG: nitrate reductase molybdenum cofactor assembly chaperone, partial [Ancrocorticia sp.]|nr:nitrate reductase molybdenum cofactor assembly chaperone [Ancrocorticia sp.]
MSNRTRPRFSTAVPPDATYVELPMEVRQKVLMAASLLLDYPGADFSRRLDAVEESRFPEPVAACFSSFCDWARAAGQRGAEVSFVATFDERRKCALELSYYAVGATRQRGQELLAFRYLYRRA